MNQSVVDKPYYYIPYTTTAQSSRINHREIKSMDVNSLNTLFSKHNKNMDNLNNLKNKLHKKELFPSDTPFITTNDGSNKNLKTNSPTNNEVDESTERERYNYNIIVYFNLYS